MTVVKRGAAAVSLAATFAALLVVAGCGGGGGSSPAPGGGTGSGPTPTPVGTSTPSTSPTTIPTTAPTSAPTLGPTAAPLANALILPSGFYGETIATGLSAPRQLVALPNGDLLVGTNDHGGIVYIVPNADAAGAAGTPSVFLTIPSPAQQGTAQGIAVDGAHANVYVATNQSVWKVPYRSGDRTEPTPSVEVAKLRRGSVAPNSDGDIHYTSSAAVVGTTLYVGVGSSCNACVETDPTRGTIQQVDLGTLTQTTKAARFRNALALAVNPATNTLWAGGAGQDGLLPMSGSIVLNVSDPRQGHPYEFFDPVTQHAGQPDYGWPDCEENSHVYNPLNKPNASCNSTTGAGTVVQPAVTFFAYSTVIGATFYPSNQSGSYAFPLAYRGGAFISMHGSWHEDARGNPLSVPEIAYVPMTGDTPTTPVNWNDPTTQWQSFLYGFQDNLGNRIGRPVGLAVGPNGSLFIADDFAGAIYRIRPATAPSAITRHPFRRR